MSIITQKYKITETSYKKMIRDGIISTTWPAHEEIVICYKEKLRQTGRSLDAVDQTSEEKNVSAATVYRAIKKLS